MVRQGAEVMDEHCVRYLEMSDYTENEIWRFHIVGELIPEVEQDE